MRRRVAEIGLDINGTVPPVSMVDACANPSTDRSRTSEISAFSPEYDVRAPVDIPTADLQLANHLEQRVEIRTAIHRIHSPPATAFHTLRRVANAENDLREEAESMYIRALFTTGFLHALPIPPVYPPPGQFASKPAISNHDATTAILDITSVFAATFTMEANTADLGFPAAVPNTPSSRLFTVTPNLVIWRSHGHGLCASMNPQEHDKLEMHIEALRRCATQHETPAVAELSHLTYWPRSRCLHEAIRMHLPRHPSAKACSCPTSQGQLLPIPITASTSAHQELRTRTCELWMMKPCVFAFSHHGPCLKSWEREEHRSGQLWRASG
ncbi:unnamed protein product [Zymoseptoria tritici ST99CH_3D1]|nr:unnamed protein product [Zymoseptoria tritici ST99CH_3D1]